MQSSMRAEVPQVARARLRKVALLPVVLLVLAALALPALPLGTGSENYARRWSERFGSVSSIRAARAAFPEVGSRDFENGEWIFFVSDDSHGDPWGGTVVAKDSRGDVRAFYGHVCGHVQLGDARSLNETYQLLSESYGATLAEGARKAARISN